MSVKQDRASGKPDREYLYIHRVPTLWVEHHGGPGGLCGGHMQHDMHKTEYKCNKCPFVLPADEFLDRVGAVSNVFGPKEKK